MHMWERAFLYLKKAGTFILAASVLIWFLASYPQDVPMSQDFDAARDQVTQEYEARDNAILLQYVLLRMNKKHRLWLWLTK
ncbi:hypothetical protein [Veillonella sp. LMAG:2]|uniref:hypothetical protein n=1 Tax=Veillonella sp. LMAG:2 TaxID=1969164 RepID=UPI0025FF6BF0|nr:hypothetical protein [Veillonella sp. LMAG:2]